MVKTFIKNNSVNDRLHVEEMLKDIIKKYPERKCKINLLHGSLTDEEMHSLYTHPKIKCLISLAHGEGFGLPLFEAAYSGLPVIAPGWSGHCDFLYAPFQGGKKKSKKESKHAYFAEVEYTIGPVQEHAIWPGVIEKEAMWCFPQEGSYKMRLRQVRKNYDKWKKKADTLQKWILENFKEEDMKERFANLIFKEDDFDVENWLGELDIEE